jgi:translocation and assembly module TamB
MRIKLDAEASGLKPADPALARALGARASFRLAAQRFEDGTLDIETARLDGEGLDASFAGRSAPKALQGRLDFAAPDLSRFAALAGLDLRGRADDRRRACEVLAGLAGEAPPEITALARRCASGRRAP